MVVGGVRRRIHEYINGDKYNDCGQRWALTLNTSVASVIMIVGSAVVMPASKSASGKHSRRSAHSEVVHELGLVECCTVPGTGIPVPAGL